MKNTILIIASTIALAGCGGHDNGSNAQDLQSDGAVDQVATVDNPAAAQAGAQPAANAQSYVAEAALSDLYEIQSSQLALEKARSAGAKAFAKQMIADHTATTQQLKALAGDKAVSRTLPTELDERRQALLDQLKGASGPAFDKAYLDQQATAHQEALLLHGNYAKNGENDELKAFAEQTTPKIQHHADQVKQLKSQGGAAG